MAKNPPRAIAATPAGKRRRGRPPKPGGRIPQVEVQRAYRARLAAAGKVVKVVDAAAAPTSPAPASISDFDPAKDGIYEREMVEGMRNSLHNALSKLELREQDVARLELRNAYLEGELKLQEQHLTNALKDNIMLKQQLAQTRPKRR